MTLNGVFYPRLRDEDIWGQKLGIMERAKNDQNRCSKNEQKSTNVQPTLHFGEFQNSLFFLIPRRVQTV
jgi:hypothetical protein